CSLRLSITPTSHHCGANLVKNLAGEYFLITAAHCISQYNAWTLDYDIALFSLSAQPPTNNYISAVCIPNEGWSEGEQAIVAGWGTSTSVTAPYKLHQVNKLIAPRATCQQIYGGSSVTDRMICAGLPANAVDSCQGDGGGPLYTYRENRWTLAGVVSWGYGCAEAGRSGVYTDVFALKAWINENINP
ncbi:unnamed protein product, partial [Candidula unifasciata]